MTEEFLIKASGIFFVTIIRISGFFMNLPAFGESIVPATIKAGLSTICCLLMLPHLIQTQTLPTMSTLGYGLMAIKELGIGLTMGFVVIITIEGIKFAGALIGVQIGLSFVQVADPESNISQAVFAEFLQLFAILIFLMLEGHLILLRVFFESFDLIPLTQMVFTGDLVSNIMDLTSNIFWLGLQISMPILCAAMLTDIALGIIARTVPRLNVFEIGFALKLSLGFSLMIVCLPFISDITKALIQKVFGNVSLILNLMSPKIK
ncbi:MAG: flagellar biosynthetic protein FliR [Candidatus Riflebacteria bacterium]|nr:flagellar biosynthetic protein FliR [Candidatus Riflebacteria bacterium]